MSVEPMRPLRVSTRDASWHNCPNAYTSKKYHFLRADDVTKFVCGRLAVANDDDETDPALVVSHEPYSFRCQHPACAKLWAEVEAIQSANGKEGE